MYKGVYTVVHNIIVKSLYILTFQGTLWSSLKSKSHCFQALLIMPIDLFLCFFIEWMTFNLKEI